MLIANGGVVEHGRNHDVVVGTLAGLVVCTETPAEAFAVVRDSHGMVSSGRDEGAVVNPRDTSGFDEDARSLSGVADHVLFRNRLGIDASLAAIEAAPDEALAVSGRGQRVMSSASDAGDGVVWNLEILDDCGRDDDGVVFASTFVDASAAKGVSTPGPDLFLAVNSKGVVSATRDIADLLATKAEQARDERFVALAFHHAEAKLILLASTPSEYDAFVVESEGVVRARGDIFDLLETRKQDGCLLNKRVGVETENAFVVLHRCLALLSSWTHQRMNGNDLRGKCPSQRRDRHQSWPESGYRRQRA